MPRTRSILAKGALLAGIAWVANAVAAPATTTRVWTIGFVPKLVGIPYFEAMRQGFEKAGSVFGARITFDGPHDASAPEQIAIVQRLIDQRLDAVGVSADSTSLLEEQATSAQNAGVLFYSSDSQVAGADVALRVSPATPEAIATAVADQMAAQIGGAGDVALVSGGPTASNLYRWIVAIKQLMAKKYPRMRIRDTLYVGEAVGEAATGTANLLASDPEIRGVIGVNSTATAGAAKAVLEAGLAGRVVVTGITDPNLIRPYVRAGVVKSAVLWNPVDLAYLTTWGVVRLLEHKPFAASNVVPGLPEAVSYDPATHTLLLGKPLVITAANVDLGF